MKRTLCLCVLLACLCAFTGCSLPMSGNEDDLGEVEYLIGVSQANLGEPWRAIMNRDIQDEANKHKNVRVIFTDAAQSNDKQIHDVEKLMKQGIDLLIISPNEAKPLTPIVQETYRKIPVIVLDREIESNSYTMFIGADNRLIGQKAGQFVSQLLGGHGGNVVEITGLIGSTPAKDRSDGFRDEIAKHSNIHIVGTVAADWLRDKAEDVMKEQFKKWSNVDVVYAHNDPMALGASRAAGALGLQGIRFIGIDGLPGTWGGLQLVQRNVLDATFIYPTGGREAVQYALKILGHEKNLPHRVTLDSMKVTKENAADYLSE